VTSFAFPSFTLEILSGDIAAESTEAIVNAANNEFWMGSGVAGAIKSRGGREIEEEAMALGPVQPGECVCTSGGRLRARFVIHAAVMGQDLRTSPEWIERATQNALRLAEERRIESIALPAFGTGVGGFPLQDCARIMIDVIRQHAAGTPGTLRTVRLVLYGKPAYDAFASVAVEMLGQDGTGN
jgi:O-acetyl-ADP-ribose deacetylase